MFVPMLDRAANRRACLATFGGGLALAGLQGGLPPAGLDAWQRFVARIGDQARRLDDPTPLEEEAHVLETAAALLRAAEHAPAGHGPWRALPGLEGAESRGLHRKAPIHVARFRLGGRTEVPLHDHQGYAVAFLVQRGSIEVSSHDPIGDVGADAAWLRPVARARVFPGRIGTLASRRENFHSIKAGTEVVEGLEIFVRTVRGQGTRFWRMEGQPRGDGARRARRLA